jgi:SAM-dependent methyltransferase
MKSSTSDRQTMTVKEHYDKHLANFYSWMTGNVDRKKQEFKKFLTDKGINPQTNKIAIDLGAGHGLQSIPLAESGFQVLAVDFNQQLLNELKANANGLPITTKIADIRNVNHFLKDKAALIVCCGDTLSHLDNKPEIEKFMADISNSLENGGKLILSFRDYSKKLTGTNRFIPVKSDDTKILTCILDYENEFVNVTDLLHEKTNDGWIQKVSSYRKVRLLPNEIEELLQKNNFEIEFNELVNGLTTMIATKK